MRIAGCPADFGGCGWYRVILPLQSLDGHDVLISPRFEDVRAFEPDVILCQRISKPEILEELRGFQQRGVRIVMDLDDDLWHLPMTNPCASMYGVGKPATRCLEAALAMADVVTVATNGLGEVVRKFCEPVVIENAVSDAHFNHARPPITGVPKRAGEIRIGYAGSPSHKADVETIRKPLHRILKKYPQVRLVSIGQELPVHQAFRDRVEHDVGIQPQPGQSAMDFMGWYYTVLECMHLDIAVAPLEDNAFNRSKSHVKALEYGLAGIPIAASNVRPYQEYGEEGLCLAPDPEAWLTILSEFCEEEEFRAMVATSAREYISQRQLISHRLPLWRDVLTA